MGSMVELQGGEEGSKVELQGIMELGGGGESTSLLPRSRLPPFANPSAAFLPSSPALAPPTACLSIGGFLTHCGWSSVVEAMRYGVPIVALLLQLDQPTNAKLVEELRVGKEVKKASGPLGSFTDEEVAEAISAVVVGEEGEWVRRRACQMARLVSWKGEGEMEAAVERMVGICEAAN